MITQADIDREIRPEACKGYATSATSNTIGVYHPEGYAPLDGCYIAITSGPGQGQRRHIDSSTVPRLGGDGILTVSPPWNTIPVVGQSYYQVEGYVDKSVSKGFEPTYLGSPEWVGNARVPWQDNPGIGADYRLLNGFS